jgi:hypothetical protein
MEIRFLGTDIYFFFSVTDCPQISFSLEGMQSAFLAQGHERHLFVRLTSVPEQFREGMAGIVYLKGRLGLPSLKRMYSERGSGKYISEVK